MVETKKYTIERSKKDFENLKEVRNQLQDRFGHHMFKTDSEIYRKLPVVYLDTVKYAQQLQQEVDDLTVKLETLEDLRASVYRIIEIAQAGEK